MSGNADEGGLELPDDHQSTQSTFASISDSPSAGQKVKHGDIMYTTVREGLAYILIPPHAPLLTDPKIQREGNAPSQSVFYNPIQQYNRDITILAIRAFGEDFVAKKMLKFRKEREFKQKNGDRKTKQIAQSLAEHTKEGTGPAAAKKRKLDNGTSESNTVHAKEQHVTPTSHASSLDHLQEVDVSVDGFLADERSVPPDVASGTTNTSPVTRDEQIKGIENVPATDSMDSRPSDPRDAPREVSLGGNGDPSKPKTDFRILDALSATGLRAIRYAKELDFVTSVTSNDLSSKAVESIKLNIKHNRLEDTVKTVTGNANAHMYNFVGQEGRGGPGPRYEVIDIDPYGTAVPFLDAAVQAIADGGLLCVTCTDTGVFNSVGFLEKAFSLYGGLPIKGDHCHEGGLRLILHAISTSAAKYGIAIEPLLSLSIDYYARVFVRVRRSPAEVKFLASKTALVYGCGYGCGAWQLQFLARALETTGKKNSDFYKHSLAQGPSAPPLCEHCGSKTHVSGPLYSGPLHNPAFIERMLSLLPSLDPKTYKTLGRIEGMLETAHEETQVFDMTDLFGKTDKIKAASPHEYACVKATAIDHHPFYVIPSALARIIHCRAPSVAQLRGALRHAGFRAVRSHAKPGSIKTDAPWSAIWHIMREWVRQEAPIKEGSLKESMAGFRILQNRNNIIQNGQSEAARVDLDSSIAAQECDQIADASKAGQHSKSDDTASPAIMFDEKIGADRQNKRLVRYQMNPRANWGPMTRAK